MQSQKIDDIRYLDVDKLRKLLELLFEKGTYRVLQRDDTIELRAPRQLTEDELDTCKVRIDSEGFKSHLSSNKEGSRPSERSFHVELLQRNENGKLPVPVHSAKAKGNGEADGVLLLELGGRDSTSSGLSDFLYCIEVSNGQTSEVFEVKATMSWSGSEARERSAKVTEKLACKRLRHATTPSQFYREYQNLKSANRLHHPNIVQMIAAFRFEENRVQFYNLLFPLAIGTLKQLFVGHLGMPSREFWTQFEALASAVAYLHNECDTAHRDLKSSNILLYEDPETSDLIAKIADFGLAVHLQDAKSWASGTKESQSALKYGAPEMRKYQDQIAQPPSAPAPASTRMQGDHFPQPEELRAADVWTLGCVFAEVLSFLVLGPTGGREFRDAITTTKDNITTDQLDDGVNIKAEVLEWLSGLGRLDARAREIGPLVKRMLAVALNRPSSTAVWESLLMSSLTSFSDGARRLRFTDSQWVKRPSMIDLWKHSIELKLGAPVYWWPLPRVNPLCEPGSIRMSWKWGGHILFLDMPGWQASDYRRRCVPVSRMPNTPTMLPLHNINATSVDSSVPGQISAMNLGGNDPRLHSTLLSPPQGLSLGSQGDQAGDILEAQRQLREIYWCVDKVWTEPSQTWLCTLSQISDDRSLCKLLSKEFKKVHGLRGQIFSWKKCTGVDFISVRFRRLFNGQDRVVRIDTGLPDKTGYEYDLFEPMKVHMAIAAEQLVIGMYESTDHNREAMGTLAMIPKKINPTLNYRMGEEGWGIHAVQGYSLFRVLVWITGVTVLGLVFVLFWLIFVNKTDLQNAFVPAAWLSTMTLMALAIPQALGVA